jgi:4'-phosphopantetheinyl transferase
MCRIRGFLMEVYWLEQFEADVPAENDWLSANEAACLDTMRFAKRRADWRLGRWTAKNAVAVSLDIPAEPQALSEIEIRRASSGAPEVFLRNEPAPVSISLSHRAGVSACALAPPDVLLGCDLEIVEPHSVAFATDYFTAEEQALIREATLADRSRLLALFWSGKESALKALREGLRLDTRRMIVSFPGMPKSPSGYNDDSSQCTCSSVPTSSRDSGWSLLQIRDTNGQIFHGWWSQTGDLLRTVLAAPPPDPPILLAQQCSLNC